MSFHHSLLAAVVAMAVVLPAFAEEASVGVEQKAQSSEPQVIVIQQSKVDINKSTIKELIKVKGITPTKAKAIIAYRKKNGDFKSLDDLKNVKGFKKMNTNQVKEIQEQLTLG